MNTRILEGSFGLVTGGTRGIGRAAVESLAAAGCHIVLTSRNEREAEAAATDVAGRNAVRVMAAACDVTSPMRVRELFDAIRRWSAGRLDILICNAGYPFRKEIWDTPLHETPPEQIEAWYEGVFRTDTLGSLYCTYEALPMMIEAKGGSIVYVSSTPALGGLQGSPYTVAKAGILGLMRDVAAVYGKYNIRANALALGSIRTTATLGVLDDATQEAIARETPLRRWGLPEEVAQAMLFLASPQSAFMTGQTLVVDGGTVRR